MLKRQTIALFLVSLLAACGVKAPLRGNETYSGQGDELTTKSKKSTPKKNPVPSPVSSPKGQDVNNQPQAPSGSANIGAACTSVASCGAPANVCFLEGYPDGMCTQACSNLCAGFCIEDRSGNGGVCHATCNSNTDCRSGYHCEERPKFNEPTVSAKVCLPVTVQGRSCVTEFQALGVGGEAWAKSADTPQICGSDVPACNIDSPMQIPNTMNGVTLVNDVVESTTLGVSCRMAHTLYRMTASLSSLGVSEVHFRRLYACENTYFVSTIQPHALADALEVPGMFHGHGESIDITSMVINGTTNTIADSWGTYDERKSDSQRAGLAAAIMKLKGDRIFTNIYTPYCNQMFGSSGTYSYPVDPFFHADIGESVDELGNTLYQIDDEEHPLCMQDFPTTCE